MQGDKLTTFDVEAIHAEHDALAQRKFVGPQMGAATSLLGLGTCPASFAHCAPAHEELVASRDRVHQRRDALQAESTALVAATASLRGRIAANTRKKEKASLEMAHLRDLVILVSKGASSGTFSSQGL